MCFKHRISMLAGTVALVLSAVSTARAVLVTADGTILFREDFETLPLGFMPGGFTTAQHGDLFLAQGSAEVRNAAPAAHQGSQYMQVIRNPELNERALFRSPERGPFTAAEIGQALHVEFALYAEGVSPANIHLLHNQGEGASAVQLAVQTLPNNVVRFYSDTAPVVQIANTLQWIPNQWQVWKIDYVVGSGSMTVSIDGVSETYNFTPPAAAVASINAIRFTGLGSDMPNVYGIDAVVPEPGTCALLVLSGVGLAASRFRRRKE